MVLERKKTRNQLKLFPESAEDFGKKKSSKNFDLPQRWEEPDGRKKN